MGLAAELKTVKKGRDYKRQALDVVIDSLDDEDRDALLATLADRSITAPAIASLLVSHGHLTDINDPAQAVRTWRNRNL